MSTTEIKRPPYFRDLQAAHRYLVARGYETSERSLRRHRQEGKLKPTARGVFSGKDVDTYAAHHLVVRAEGTTAEVSDLQEAKARADSEYLEASAAIDALKRRQAAGELIPRRILDRELVERAVILRAGLVNEVLFRMSDLLASIEGDTRRTPDTLLALEDVIEDGMDRVAQSERAEVWRNKAGQWEGRVWKRNTAS